MDNNTSVCLEHKNIGSLTKHLDCHRRVQLSRSIHFETQKTSRTGFIYRSSTNRREIEISLIRVKNGTKMELRPRRSRQKPQSQKSPAITSFSWGDLPIELREIILKKLEDDYDGVPEEGRQRCAAYATVCSEWQGFFEKIIFRKLVMHASDLDGFAKIIKRRTGGVETRNLVGASKRRKLATEALPVSSTLSRMPVIKHLWLRVELPPYGCPECRRAQSPAEVVR